MASESQEVSHQIGTLNEKPLHAALKGWYARPGDMLEVSVDGFLVDILRGNLLVEIQTQNFAAIRQKLARLTGQHAVRLVHPIAREKWIVKVAQDGQGQLSRRKSPKHGILEDVFDELVSFPRLLSSPNFSLEVVLIQAEEVRCHCGSRGRRRKDWRTLERRLLRVVERRLFESPAEMAALVSPALVEPFATSDLASALGRPLRLAQKMAYCLREMGAIKAVGKRGNAVLYTRAAA